MADSSEIMRERQRGVRREMNRRGIAPKVVMADAQMSSSTFFSYFPDPEGKAVPAVMPLSALFQIIEGKALPLDLISMLLPNGAVVVRVPEDVDHEALCDAMQGYLAEKARAHRQDSECGPAIGPNEDARLTQLAVVAGTAVAA
jgi:hypothetical protein